jgi:Tfp pilus assembly protein PilX
VTIIRKKGFVLIYVLILITMVMMICGALLDSTLMDYKTSINLVDKQQTYYNAETGLLDALNRYKVLIYDIHKQAIYYMDLSSVQMFINQSLPQKDNYVKVKVTYVWDSKRTYNIESTGYYKGCEYKIVKEFSE